MKKTDFVGIDISHETIDCALINVNQPKTKKENKFVNSIHGFEQMKAWLKKNKVMDVFFCMEHTGTYGLLLFAWLSHNNYDYCVEPGLKIKRSLGITRGKNDKIDAGRIADYALTNIHKLKTFSLPSNLLIQIKQQLTYRDQLVRIRTSLKNSLKSHMQYEVITGKHAVTMAISAQIKDLNQKVSDVERSLLKLIESDEELKKNFKLITTVKGIGLVIATFMLVTTNNFTSFQDGRTYACYSGVAPFSNESGTSIRGKTCVSNLANKKIKTLLSNGANSAVTWDPEIKTYYKRKIAEGKHHKAIINAVSCKLINRVFAVVKRQTPFVITYQQKVA